MDLFTKVTGYFFCAHKLLRYYKTVFCQGFCQGCVIFADKNSAIIITNLQIKKTKQRSFQTFSNIFFNMSHLTDSSQVTEVTIQVSFLTFT
jgi:hypothetical protein